jgi:hypothetical protein
MVRRWFLNHPAAVGETYSQHFRTALGFSAALLAAGAACLVHALIPALFERTASRAITRLFHALSARQNETALSSGDTDPSAPFSSPRTAPILEPRSSRAPS